MQCFFWFQSWIFWKNNRLNRFFWPNLSRKSINTWHYLFQLFWLLKIFLKLWSISSVIFQIPWSLSTKRKNDVKEILAAWVELSLETLGSTVVWKISINDRILLEISWKQINRYPTCHVFHSWRYVGGGCASKIKILDGNIFWKRPSKI